MSNAANKTFTTTDNDGLSYTATVSASGLVVTTVRGTSREHREYIDETFTRECGPLDLQLVADARARTGWTEL